MNNIDELRHYLQSLTKGTSNGWCGQRALDCAGLSQLLPIDFIVCCDYGQDISELEKQVPIFSVEKAESIRRNWSNDHLDLIFSGELGQQFKNFCGSKFQHFLCYRSVRFLENLQRQMPNQYHLAAIPLDLKNYFDNKLILYNQLPELHLRVIPGEITKLSSVTFRQLSKKYGLPFVIQLPIGSSGNNTFFIFNEKEFEHIFPRIEKSDFKVSRYLPSYSLNINAAIIRNRTYVSFPSVQIVGARQCATRPSIFCGNDFGVSAQVPISIIEESYRTTKIMSRWLISEGYRGIFGLDLLVSDDKVYVIEINPRLQNSTDVLTISQLRKKQIPLIALHLLEFLDSADFSPVETEQFQQQQGAQVILHNLERKRVSVNGEIKPGIYRYIDGALHFQRSGISLLEGLESGEFLINCGVPYKNQIIEKSASLLKIQTNDLVMKENLVDLNDWAAAIVSNIYNQLKLRPSEDASHE